MAVSRGLLFVLWVSSWSVLERSFVSACTDESGSRGEWDVVWHSM